MLYNLLIILLLLTISSIISCGIEEPIVEEDVRSLAEQFQSEDQIAEALEGATENEPVEELIEDFRELEDQIIEVEEERLPKENHRCEFRHNIMYGQANPMDKDYEEQRISLRDFHSVVYQIPNFRIVYRDYCEREMAEELPDPIKSTGSQNLKMCENIFKDNPRYTLRAGALDINNNLFCSGYYKEDNKSAPLMFKLDGDRNIVWFKEFTKDFLRDKLDITVSTQCNHLLLKNNQALCVGTTMTRTGLDIFIMGVDREWGLPIWFRQYVHPDFNDWVLYSEIEDNYLNLTSTSSSDFETYLLSIDLEHLIPESMRYSWSSVAHTARKRCEDLLSSPFCIDDPNHVEILSLNLLN